MDKNEEEKLLNKRWVKAVMTLLFLGTTYGFASLAIDSGSLIEYALTFFFLIWAIKSAMRATRKRSDLGKR